jgi:hypothetical protein
MVGVMELWSIELLDQWIDAALQNSNTPSIQYSIDPALQYSNTPTPFFILPVEMPM